jgi:pimeloyl-ACP methyl ester carboxylesterase
MTARFRATRRGIHRRQLLCGAAATLVARSARADGPSPGYDPDEDLRNLKLLDLREAGRRFVLITPRFQNPDAKLPLAIFLHGLGETTDERLGAYAWVERYGLGSAWHRLKRDPIARTSKRGEWTDGRLAEVNAELAARPFRGFAMACPFMPKPSGAASLDEYAGWIAGALLPRCRKEVPVFSDAARTYLCGVSLGGYVSLEVLVRHPQAFGAWAGLQTAIGTFAANKYAEKIAKSGPRPMLVLTSTLDHWRSSSEALAAALRERNVPHTFRIIPGPHDQPWLREAGTIEALLWLDRVHQPDQPEAGGAPAPPR